MNSKKSKQIYNVVIIGAGRIAAGFDTPKTKEVLTHAHAVVRNKQTRLVGFVDTDAEAAQAAAKRWGTHAFKSISDAFAVAAVDIVIVATPDHTHAAVLSAVRKHNPRLVICEKPLTTDLRTSKKILAAYREARIPLVVNYSRRFDSAVQKIKNAIQQNTYGPVLWASAVYAKGILHNGSHAVDTARFLFGEITKATVHTSRSDYSTVDPTVGAHLAFERCANFYLLPGDERAYSIFEFEIGFAKKRVRLVASGFTQLEQIPKKDPRFAGYVELDLPRTAATGLGLALPFLLAQCVSHLTKRTPLTSLASDAFATQETCFMLLNQAKRLK